MAYLFIVAKRTANKRTHTENWGEIDALIPIIQMLCSVTRIHACDENLVSRALADLYSPAILIDSDKVIFAPGKVPSGSPVSYWVNTKRHQNQTAYICVKISEHGNILEHGEHCGDAEFMRRSFHIDQTGPTWNIRTSRSTVRVLAKLFKGSATESVASFLPAVMSSIWDCGYNRPLYDILQKMYTTLYSAAGDVDISFDKYTRRHKILEDWPPDKVPPFNYLANMEGTLLEPHTQVTRYLSVKEILGEHPDDLVLP